MTTLQRRLSAQTLANLAEQDRHSTQIALATPVIDPVVLSSLCKSDRVAAGALLAHLDIQQLTTVAIACASWGNGVRSLTGENEIRTEDMLDAFDRIIAAYHEEVLPVSFQPSVFDRAIGLESNTVLRPEVLREAHMLAMAESELEDGRWQRALTTGLAHLLNEWGFTIYTNGAYYWKADHANGGNYATTPKACGCEAFTNGKPCKHRGAAIILSFAIEAMDQLARRQRRAA